VGPHDKKDAGGVNACSADHPPCHGAPGGPAALPGRCHQAVADTGLRTADGSDGALSSAPGRQPTLPGLA
jgi:hypothetical protein